MMIGSDAVIGLPGNDSVAEWDLTGKVRASPGYVVLVVVMLTMCVGVCGGDGDADGDACGRWWW